MPRKKQNQKCIIDTIAQLADATAIQLYTQANHFCVEFTNKAGVPEHHALDLKGRDDGPPERIDFKLEPYLKAFIHDCANAAETNFILESIVLLRAKTEKSADPKLALLIEYWSNKSRISLMSGSTGENLARYEAPMLGGTLRFYSIDLSGYLPWARIVTF